VSKLDETILAQLGEGRKPRILFIDLENTPVLGWAWDGYETTILEIEQDPRILCFSYKWQDEKKIHNVSLRDFPYKPNRHKINDWYVVEKLWALFDEADIIIAQNGDKFDIRVANARFLQHGLPPPADYKTVDTLKIAKRYFKLTFNSLDHLCRFLKLERKADPGSKKTWFDCMDGKKAAWDHMTYYCNRDVGCLVNVYDCMKGWAKNHPNLSLYTRNTACPVCQSKEQKKDGYSFQKTGRYQRYACMECGHRYASTELLSMAKVMVK
jgi:DNA-directed RNA polymerase subunit RPC12/RpoP